MCGSNSAAFVNRPSSPMTAAVAVAAAVRSSACLHTRARERASASATTRKAMCTEKRARASAKRARVSPVRANALNAARVAFERECCSRFRTTTRQATVEFSERAPRSTFCVCRRRAFLSRHAPPQMAARLQSSTSVSLRFENRFTMRRTAASFAMVPAV